MTEDQILPIHFFVVVSAISLWVSSLFLMPTNTELHVIHMMGIVIHFLYFSSFNKYMWILFHLLTVMTIIIHVHYLEMIVISFLVLHHGLHHGLLFSSFLSVEDKIFWILFLDTFSKNLYMTGYLLNQNQHTTYSFLEKLS